MVSTQDGHTVLGRHSSSISEWISVHIGTYCIRMDNTALSKFILNRLNAGVEVYNLVYLEGGWVEVSLISDS